MSDSEVLLQAGLKIELVCNPFGSRSASQHTPMIAQVSSSNPANLSYIGSLTVTLALFNLQPNGQRVPVRAFRSQNPSSQSVNLDALAASTRHQGLATTTVSFGEVSIDRPGTYVFVVALTALAIKGGEHGQVMLGKVDTGVVVV